MKGLLDRLKPVMPGFLRRVFFEKAKVETTGRTAAEIFRDIYRFNAWGSAESRSGIGSTLGATARLRSELPEFLKKLGVRSMMDLPCGDFHWMQRVRLDGVTYTGVDIVPDLIERHQRVFARAGRSFLLCDVLQDPPPRADLIFCRDLLIHLSYSDILRALQNMAASGSTWLLTTTFREGRNRLEPTGGFFRINLEQAPFAFPAPADILADGEGKTAPNGRVLGLWKLADLDLQALADRLRAAS